MHALGRRGLLQSVAALIGVAAMPPAGAQALFAGAESLPQDKMNLLTAVADTVIPATDTPGAVEAGVPAMFDKLVANWASGTHRAQILAALQAIEAETQRLSGAGFAALSPARRYEILSAFDRAHMSEPGYAKLRELVIALYYLSEPGSTIELRYEQSPGKWEPSLPVTEQTRNYGGL